MWSNIRRFGQYYLNRVAFTYIQIFTFKQSFPFARFMSHLQQSAAEIKKYDNGDGLSIFEVRIFHLEIDAGPL